jgi:hypothetical protein
MAGSFQRTNIASYIAQSVSALMNAAFWNMTLCGSSKNGRFGGMYRLHHQGEKSVD